MKILVTGGAGYIGSFMVRRLLEDDHEVVVVDSLERGHKEYIDKKATFIQGNLNDKKFVEDIFSHTSYDGILHFAAYISVAESMQNPGMYFINNSIVPIYLLDEMAKKGISNFIFSSTAAVYGNPKEIPIPEDHSKHPENPYGQSKLMVEEILSWYEKIYGISYTCLRYFNASGAALDGSMGENHTPENHIIPKVLESVIQKKSFDLFGDDYKTEDGTCVRDYIHVLDLVNAHVLALEQLKKSGGVHHYNVGTGNGYSNKQVIDMVGKVTGLQVHVDIKSRRPGDPGTLVADASAIQKDLGFSPRYSDLETIIASAYKWHSQKK